MLQEVCVWRREAGVAGGSGRHSARGAQNIGQQNPHKMHGLWLLQFWLFLFPCQGRALYQPIQNQSRTEGAGLLHTYILHDLAQHSLPL